MGWFGFVGIEEGGDYWFFFSVYFFVDGCVFLSGGDLL